MTKEEKLEKISDAIERLKSPLTETEWRERMRLVDRFWQIVHEEQRCL